MNEIEPAIQAMEALRRSPYSPEVTAKRLPDGTDYSNAGLLIDHAVAHLNEGIPNRQKDRVALALKNLAIGVDALLTWAEANGYLEPLPEEKLWLWQNKQHEFWAFDNPYPINLHNGDPQTLGEPVGYALVKPSRNGRPEVTDEMVTDTLRRMAEYDRIERERRGP